MPTVYPFLRPLLFALPPDEAHAVGLAALGALDDAGWLRERVAARLAPPAALATTRMGLRFPSPVGLAGGFDKNARAPRALAALGFGFLELGTVTAIAQGPNPRPNLFRLPADRALVNRLGFPNEGAASVARSFRARVGARGVGVPVAFSIGKSRVVPVDDLARVTADYLESFRAVAPVADFVVVNVSSPNTKGLRALQGAAFARPLLEAIATENEKGDRRPLLLKISPDLDEPSLEELLDVARDARLDGVIATNTTLSRQGLKTPPAVVDAAGAGGLSGPPLRARVQGWLPRIRARLGPSRTIIGVGGVGSADDVRRFLAAGADLVQLYTSFVYEGPSLPSRLARALSVDVPRGD